jgi:hypothetical protein
VQIFKVPRHMVFVGQADVILYVMDGPSACLFRIVTPFGMNYATQGKPWPGALVDHNLLCD